MTIPSRLVLASGLLLLAGCSASPDNLAEEHLSFIQTGNVSEAREQYCVLGESLRLHDVRNFEIVSTTTKSRYGFEFTEIVANVDTSQFKLIDPGTGPQQIPIRQVTIEVWDSDDFYEGLVLSIARFNELSQRNESITGIPEEPLDTPGREAVNPSKLCAFLPFEQF